MSWIMVADVAGLAFMLTGALLCALAGVGLLRLPDVLTRLHAATKPQSLGLLLVLIGAGLWMRSFVDLSTLLLIGVFQLLTSPVSAHLVGRAAYRTNRVDRDNIVRDELGEALSRGEQDKPQEGGPTPGGPGVSEGPESPSGSGGPAGPGRSPG